MGLPTALRLSLLLGLFACFTLQAGFSSGSEAELQLHGHGFYSSPLFRFHSPFNYTYFGSDLNSVAPADDFAGGGRARVP